jgi:1-aminocyclopropane-1-carboxylate deaminase/D-cysteine desulfhydrase-like pyridoxal-dependent ACC family enzyme
LTHSIRLPPLLLNDLTFAQVDAVVCSGTGTTAIEVLGIFAVIETLDVFGVDALNKPHRDKILVANVALGILYGILAAEDRD